MISDHTVLFALLQIVIKEIGHAVENLCFSDRPRTSPTKITLLSLWFLANQETFRQISDRFDTVFNTDLLYYCAHFIVKADEKN